MRRIRARTVLAIAAPLLATAAACREGDAPREPPVGGPGTYVVVSDSSRVGFVLPASPEPVVGTLRVRGALTFEEDSRGFLTGGGALAVDLTQPSLPDSGRAVQLAERLFGVRRDPELRTAELTVRNLTGQWFRSDLIAGDVRSVRAVGRLTALGMALARPFEGEIAPTRSGYRLTTTMPVIFTADDFELDDELADFQTAAQLDSVGRQAVVTVDLWLSRREEGTAPGAP